HPFCQPTLQSADQTMFHAIIPGYAQPSLMKHDLPTRLTAARLNRAQRSLEAAIKSNRNSFVVKRERHELEAHDIRLKLRDNTDQAPCSISPRKLRAQATTNHAILNLLNLSTHGIIMKRDQPNLMPQSHQLSRKYPRIIPHPVASRLKRAANKQNPHPLSRSYSPLIFHNHTDSRQITCDKI